ncbi:hypothetical protein CBF34_06975 [Vagococcus penaei]|uniref:Uncharacterized protein n=1 Tax=Vagococcus penaei TaxID=633807 RepID=A0A1Q2D3J3_9ENTE|nr:hypothetical protein [Vagococcus penaei]AQP52907.1 hypothetical protein BW732_00810 [Vagococcus penaei]RSU01396.1 hypothetical protein CBF34_06975 [Vagococcus penaei]
MVKKNTNKKYGPILYLILGFYVIELVWFFYSQIFKKLANNQVIDVASKELAVILVISMLILLIFMILRKSRKISSVVIGVLIFSVIAFCILAPIFDVYIPVLWQIFHSLT